MEAISLIVLGLFAFLMLSAGIAFAIFKYQTRRVRPKKTVDGDIREQIRTELASEEMRELIRAEIRTELTKEKLRAEIRAELEAEMAELAKARAVGTKNHTTMF